MTKVYDPTIYFGEIVVGETFYHNEKRFIKVNENQAEGGEQEIITISAWELVRAISVRLDMMLVNEGDFIYNAWSKIYGRIDKITQKTFVNHHKLQEPYNVEILYTPLFRKNGRPFGKKVKQRTTWANAVEAVTSELLELEEKEAILVMENLKKMREFYNL